MRNLARLQKVGESSLQRRFLHEPRELCHFRAKLVDFALQFKQITTKVQAFLSRKPRGRLSSGDRAVLYDGRRKRRV